MIFLTLSFLLYFAPALLATSRRNPNAPAIWLTNFFVGWTVIGWVLTLVWAMRTPAMAGTAPAYGVPPGGAAWPATAPQQSGAMPGRPGGAERGEGGTAWSPVVELAEGRSADAVRTCVGCNRVLPPDARFCPACGSVESRLG